MPVLIQVDSIKVRSLSLSHYDVTWQVVSTSEDVLDYTFQVMRSEAPAGPWTPISPEMEDRYIFVDNNLPTHNAYRVQYYLIRVRHKPSGDVKDFGPADPGAEPDLVATEIRKHINLLMREFVGRRCWILPVRTFGQRCTCFNPTLKGRTRSGCRTCFDTGFVRGYHHPIEAFMQFDPNPNNYQQSNLGELQQSNTTMRMGFFPPLKPKDLIIEPENQRWRVVNVSGTQRLRAVVHQEIQVHAIPLGDTEYLININLGTGEVLSCNGTVMKPINFNDLFLAGARNFTNPQNFDNFKDDEVQGLFSSNPNTFPKVGT